MSNNDSQRAGNVCTLELDSPSKYQTELHFPSVQTHHGDQDQVPLDILRNDEEVNSSWGNRTRVEMLCNVNKDTYKFSVNKRFHHLDSVQIQFKIPPFALKQYFQERGYQICWPHNLGFEQTIKGSFVVGENRLSMDREVLNIMTQFKFDKHGAGKEDNFNKMIGNTKALQSWSKALPAATLEVDQPWYFSWHDEWAFPICKAINSDIYLEYEFKTNIFEVLRLRRPINSSEESEDGYIYLEPTDEYFVGVKEANLQFPKPKMMACYHMGGETSYKYHTRSPDSRKVINMIDFIHLGPENPTVFGQKVPVDVRVQDPALALFGMAENLRATDIGNMSCYNTDAHGISGGFSPISNITMAIGNSDRYPGQGITLYDGVSAHRDFPSAPREPGYLGISFTENFGSSSIIGTTRLVNDYKVVFTMGDTDPYLAVPKEKTPSVGETAANGEIEVVEKVRETSKNSTKDIVDPNSYKYRIHLILAVVRKAEFYREGEDKDTGKYDINSPFVECFIRPSEEIKKED